MIVTLRFTDSGRGRVEAIDRQKERWERNMLLEMETPVTT